MDHFGIDECTSEVGVDFASGLGRCFSSADGPGSNFISADGIKMGDFQLVIASPDNILHFGLRAVLALDLILVFNREREHFGQKLAVHGDDFFNFCLVRNVLLEVVLFGQINEVDHWF